MLRGGAGLAEAGAHRARGGGIVARRAFQYLAHAGEPAHLVVGGQIGIVGDVVGDAGETVEGVDVHAQILADQERPDREILVAASLAGRGFDRRDLGAMGGFGSQRGQLYPLLRYPFASNQATASAMASFAGRGL